MFSPTILTVRLRPGWGFITSNEILQTFGKVWGDVIFDNGSHQIGEVHGMIPAPVTGFVLYEVAFVSTGGNGAV